MDMDKGPNLFRDLTAVTRAVKYSRYREISTKVMFFHLLISALIPSTLHKFDLQNEWFTPLLLSIDHKVPGSQPAQNLG